MNYLERLRTIKKDKEDKKLFVIEDTKETWVDKEAKEDKEVTSHSALPIVVDTTLLGHIVTWESPLFGLLRATVLEDLREHGIRVFHPLTERDCVIPVDWLRLSKERDL
jgi:hypothetical protein